MTTAISLSQFLVDDRETAQTFAAWWIFNNKKNPDHFPDQMNPGEWDEQYRSFDEAQARAEMAQAKAAIHDLSAKYGRRRDGSAWISIGDPLKGPHFQTDFDAPDWVFAALGVESDRAFNKTQGTDT